MAQLRIPAGWVAACNGCECQAKNYSQALEARQCLALQLAGLPTALCPACCYVHDWIRRHGIQMVEVNGELQARDLTSS